MNIPKKKYRDKVRDRLVLVKTLFADRKRVEEMMKRVGGFGIGSDFHNKMDHLYRFFDVDVPALLDALDNIHKPENQS
jgi:hypothetical protein